MKLSALGRYLRCWRIFPLQILLGYFVIYEFGSVDIAFQFVVIIDFKVVFFADIIDEVFNTAVGGFDYFIVIFFVFSLGKKD